MTRGPCWVGLPPVAAAVRELEGMVAEGGWPSLALAYDAAMHRCGPFTLTHRLAAGAMGEVWAGEADGLPVAVKFLSLGDDLARAAFLAEVGALARLSHPYIVPVLDHGLLERGVPDGPAAGTPWMATGFAGGGTLASVAPSLGWGGVRAALLGLLDALGYAHARGVVHRDVKPANILLSRLDDPNPGIRLADFGIARVTDGREIFGGAIVGSPRTMSPEQASGHAAAMGPWSDLYAVGCVAWWLVHGTWPHRASGREAILAAHRRGERGPWQPRIEVPAGFQAWVDRALAVAVVDRFQRAADAARGLLALDEGDEPPPPVLRDAVSRARHLPLGAWRRLLPASEAQGPRGWGHGALALREWPTTGRDEACDAAWRALDRVEADGRPQLLVFQGPPGVGCTHMARWLGSAADRAGRAHVIRAPSRADDADGAPLARLLHAALGTERAPREQLADAARAAWARIGVSDPELVRYTTAALTGPPGPMIRGVLRRWLLERARDRPVVVVVEGGLTPGVWSFLCAAATASAPLLLVVDPGGAPLPPVDDRVAVCAIPLGPLSATHLGQLLDRSFPAVPSLRRALVRDADGRPGRLRSRLRDLAARSALIATPDGFTVDGPLDVGPLTGSVAADRPPDERRRLILAAQLGATVDLARWAAADDVGHARPEERLGSAIARFRLQSRLERAGVWRSDERTATWVDEAARQATLADAQRSGDDVGAHLAMAAALRDLDPVQAARHQIAAGDVAEGAQALIRAVADTPPAVWFLDAVEEAMVATRERHLPLWRQLACLHMLGGNIADALQEVVAIERVTVDDPTADPAVLRHCACTRIVFEAAEGSDAEASLHRLWEASDTGGLLDLLSRLRLFDMALWCPDLDVRPWAEALSRSRIPVRWQQLFETLLLLRCPDPDPRVALDRFTRHADDLDAQGFQRLAQDVLNHAISLAADSGDLDRAKDLAERSVALAAALDLGNAIGPVNAAQIALRRREPAEARAWIDRARGERGWRGLALALTSLEWVWACQTGDLALARTLAPRLPPASVLQELGEALMRPTVDALRAIDPAQAQIAADALWGTSSPLPAEAPPASPAALADVDTVITPVPS